VALDAVVETELVAALKVSVFPEVIFTKAGKILFRDKGIDLLPNTKFNKENNLLHLFIPLCLTMTNFYLVDSQQFVVQMSGQKSWPSFTTVEPNHRV